MVIRRNKKIGPYSVANMLRRRRHEAGSVSERYVTVNSSTDRLISIANIAVTGLLSLAAIHFGLQYNRHEEKRETERLARERTDALLRENGNRRLALTECTNFEIALASRPPFGRNEPLRLALARSIEYHVAKCALIGYPVDKYEALRLLARLGDGASERVKSRVASARTLVRRAAPTQISARQQSDAAGRLAENFRNRSHLDPGPGVYWSNPEGPFRINIAEAILLPVDPEDDDANKLLTFSVGTAF